MGTPADWWKTFFSGVTLDFWSAATTPEQARAEADFIQRTLRVHPPARVLDVPCGNGRLALEMARRGYRMTGVDLAEAYVREATARAAEERLPAVFEQRDMRDLPWPGEFEGAFCFGNSLGYLDDQGNTAFLEAVARALRPGARFLLDYGAAAESLLPNYQERRWYEAGGIYLLIHNRYDHVHSRIDTAYTFVRDGRVEKRPSTQRVYTYRELCALLAGAGFGECEGYASPAGEPYQLGAHRLLLVTRKRLP
jgi:SAM-dependent methyltransferase